MKEYEVGQIVTINGVKTRVTKSDGCCKGCICNENEYEDTCDSYECRCTRRSDHTDVIFAPLSSTHTPTNNESGVVASKEEENVLDARETSEFQLPPKKMQVWIRGNKERGKDVIKMLTDLGAENPINYLGDDVNTIYSIDKYNQINWLDIHSNTASLIANFYKEIKLPWKPKDKELVWCWDTTDTCGRMLKFYDGKHRGTYQFNGKRGGFSYERYAPYKGEWPQWAKEAVKKLKE